MQFTEDTLLQSTVRLHLKTILDQKGPHSAKCLSHNKSKSDSALSNHQSPEGNVSHI